MAEVDISRYHFRRELGFLAVIGTWAKTEDGPRRCLAIMRKWAYGSSDMRIFVVFDDVDLPEWSLDTLHGNYIGAMKRALQACRDLDIDESAANCHAIITLVCDHLYDLIMMPPRPAGEMVPVADIVITERESGRRVEKELRIDV